MTARTRRQPLTLADAQAEAVTCPLRRGGGYCAMRHPDGPPGVCTRRPNHPDHHRDWYQRETPLGPYLDWTDAEYA
ncbi:hypothetical protein ACFYY3_33125 [Streptomyces sp. NPDC001812]|uniref:hypothetical protein n=1 Tax=Streptomyces sp. NPDC001812 TaxID=3364611 RepID=UPI003679F32B